MSSPGWYPDPAGDPDLQRYWDGSGWSSQTRPVDKSAPEGPSAWPELEQQQAEAWSPVEAPGRRRTGLFVALGVVAVLVVGGGVAAAVTLGGHDESAGPGPSAGPSVSVSASPSASSTALPIVNDCPSSDYSGTEDKPKDGRVHGGGLSFPHQPGSTWRDVGLPWANDVQSEAVDLKGSWSRLYAVGLLPSWSGYTSLQSTAETLMSCIAHDKDSYPNATRFVPKYSRATKVSGDDAWEVRANVYVADGPYPGGTVHVVVVDTGRKSYSAFMGDSPIGVKSDLAVLDKVVKGLRVDK